MLAQSTNARGSRDLTRSRSARSVIMPTVTERRAAFARLAIVFTIVSYAIYFGYWLWSEFILKDAYDLRLKVEAVVYLFIVTMLVVSSLSFLACRLGYFNRVRIHKRIPRAIIDEYFAEEGFPTLTVLVPSYREEPQVIRNTLLSAALQEYENLTVVLLLDDPPNPTTNRHAWQLEQARGAVQEIEEVLAEPSYRFRRAQDRLRTLAPRGADLTDEMDRLATHFEFATEWLNSLADTYPRTDHSDTFLAEEVFRVLAADLALTAGALRSAMDAGATLPLDRLVQLGNRLTSIFEVTLSSFERKQYISLSHEASKASNLNSYLGLIGGNFDVVHTPRGKVLAQSDSLEADLMVPNSEFVLTLDADSVLLPEYALRLIYLMNQPEHARVAVAQTPYNAFPDAKSKLERIAGATTDIQYIVHQGLTQYGATFWVGANAILRKSALEEVVEIEYVGGWAIKRYIQDRTAIEDTESTIDLGDKGWSLLNYPERLAYSATPPDFGSLCIQRRRWADGGLVIMPKLLRQARRRRKTGHGSNIGEFILRTNYMSSLAWSSAGLIILLAYPFRPSLTTPLLGLIALPYFVAMANDLKYLGYRRTDIFRVYGFNLVLMAVNLAGTGNSIIQMFTGEKGSFGRTPKVKTRTVAPLLFVLSAYAVVGISTYTSWRYYEAHRWYNLIYAGLNMLLSAYAVLVYIGIRNSIVDIWLQSTRYLQKPKRHVQPASSAPAEIIANPEVTDWRAVLYFGASNATFDLLPTLATPVERTPHRPNIVPRPVLTAVDVRAELLEPAPEETYEPTFTTLFQPVLDLRCGEVVGYEALARFDDGTSAPSALLRAKLHDRHLALESKMFDSAVTLGRILPKGTWIGINATLDLYRESHLLDDVRTEGGRKIVLELPRTAFDRRDEGPKLPLLDTHRWTFALNDTEPDLYGLRFLLDQEIRFAKVPRAWIENVEHDPVKRALLESLVQLSHSFAFGLVAVGVETASEAAAIRAIGFSHAQGRYYSEPKEAEELAPHVASFFS